MMVNINIPLPVSCASCPLSVRHFGKLYCPPLDGRVGNEGKDSRCPLHESVTINDTADKIKVTNCNDNISRQAICDALDKAFADRIKMFDYDSYEKADEKTQLVCDGIMRAIDVVLGQPTVDHFADVSKKDLISRQDVEDMLKKMFPERGMWEIDGDKAKDAICETLVDAMNELQQLPSAQPELIEQGAYVRGFEQGRTQGMIDAQGGKK